MHNITLQNKKPGITPATDRASARNRNRKMASRDIQKRSRVRAPFHWARARYSIRWFDHDNQLFWFL